MEIIISGGSRLQYKTECIESAGNGIWNEDRILIRNNLIGVIDGATPIHNFKYRGYSTMAEWLVDNFEKKILAIPQEKEIDYKIVSKNIIKQLEKDDFVSNLKNYDKPCFTSATLTLKNDNVLCQVIGDSYIYIQKKNGDIIELTDNRVDLYAAKTVKAVLQAKADKDNVANVIEKQKIENRKRMNGEGGYWVIGFEGEFENEFLEMSYKENEISKILICSDGFERLMKEFSLIDVKHLFSRKILLNEAMLLLRHYEEENWIKDNYPCVKKSDDATAIMISFI